ncbi:uncharacterized protein LOC123675522 isoform X1 [Harmonia axyridis]|uniref:uncharacterized protein LOC123675522 isoform X1 n=1 Tax=Harmonia axyridis TaxID=115357 RepID=UPI001E275B70|nr:uncharacterized protein LOC123675522 isoform X1 [Harmonia axyridis]
MRSISFMSLIIISTLILFFPLSSKCNPDEKNWLDRCDINRLKERPPEIPSATSLPYTTTTKKKGIFWWWKDKGFPLRPMAHEKEIFEILKEKLMEEVGVCLKNWILGLMMRGLFVTITMIMNIRTMKESHHTNLINQIIQSNESFMLSTYSTLETTLCKYKLL